MLAKLLEDKLICHKLVQTILSCRTSLTLVNPMLEKSKNLIFPNCSFVTKELIPCAKTVGPSVTLIFNCDKTCRAI